MTEKENMLQYKVYDTDSEDNRLHSSDEMRRKELLQKMLGKTGKAGHPGQFSSCW